jgi:hypothetical protein
VGVKLEFSAQDEMSQRILKLLQDLLKRKRPTTNQSQSSPAEQLRELVKLHDEGLITDEEFKLKRDRLLEQL